MYHSCDARLVALCVLCGHCRIANMAALGRCQQRRPPTLANLVLPWKPFGVCAHQLEKLVESGLPRAAAADLLHPGCDPFKLSAAVVKPPADLPKREGLGLLPWGEPARRGGEP